MRLASIAVVLLAGTASADSHLDAGFRDEATQLAAAQDRFVAGWGTLRLDGSRKRYHFATLLPVQAGEQRGAYLIEQAPDALWLVTFNMDGRTDAYQHADVIPVANVPWTISNDTAIMHLQGHHHGGESLSFGLRGSELVLLTYTSRDDITDSQDHEIKETYARRSAPLLANAFTRDSALAVAGPARVVAALVEPTASRLHVDFDQLAIANDADALAVWAKIAPTAGDLDKLSYIPDGLAQAPLALAVLRAGQYTCPAAPASKRCGLVHTFATPAPTAGFGDGCVRRRIALWALQTLADHHDVVPTIADTLRTIAKLPAPESELVDAALDTASDQPELQRELAMIAWNAGHHDSAKVEDVLARSADGQLESLARTTDCASVALAAVVRERAGDSSLAPARPHARDSIAMTRQLCVLAHYVELGGQHATLDDFISLTGFEQVGREATAVPSDGAVLPDLVLAARCTGTTCVTDDTRISFEYAREHDRLVMSRLVITPRVCQ